MFTITSIESLSVSQKSPAQRAWELPELIQGGMGIGVSGPKLAAAVAASGELGVVSGVDAIDVVTRLLQNGDGATAAALLRLPDEEMALRIYNRYYLAPGERGDRPYLPVPKAEGQSRVAAEELNMAAVFTLISSAKDLAKQWNPNPGPIGLNVLEKTQRYTLSALYGAALAGVDVVIVGAGIPDQLPLALARLTAGKRAAISYAVHGANRRYVLAFRPARYPKLRDVPMSNPVFLPIISSHVLGQRLLQNPYPPHGFIAEGPEAGGHSAPPRDKVNRTYGPKDTADPEKLAALGLPFWLAGGYGTPEGLITAKSYGARGVQVGTAFALCRESGFAAEIRHQIVQTALEGELKVKNGMNESPTGFPFKVAELDGTLSEADVYANRQRLCGPGQLKEPFEVTEKDGRQHLIYRCTAEAIAGFLSKGGELSSTVGRVCLCKALLAAIGLGDKGEPAIVTLGESANELIHRLDAEFPSAYEYSAADIVAWLHNQHLMQPA